MQSTALFGIVLAIATSELIYELVHVVNADAMTYLALTRDSYDVIVLDLPDPTNLPWVNFTHRISTPWE